MPLDRETLRKNIAKRVAEKFLTGTEKPTSWGRRVATPEIEALSDALTDRLMETEIAAKDSISPEEIESLKGQMFGALQEYKKENPGKNVTLDVREGGVLQNIRVFGEALVDTMNLGAMRESPSDIELETFSPPAAQKPKPTVAEILQDLDSDAEHSAPSTPVTPITPVMPTVSMAAPAPEVPAKSFMESLLDDVKKDIVGKTGYDELSPGAQSNFNYVESALEDLQEESTKQGYSLEQRLTPKGREELVSKLSSAIRHSNASESEIVSAFDDTMAELNADKKLLMGQEEVVRKTISKQVAKQVIPEESIAGAAKSLFGRIVKSVAKTEVATSERDAKVAELSAAIQERLIQDVGIPVLSKLSKEETEAVKAEIASAVEGYKKGFPSKDVAAAVRGRGAGREVDPLKYITDPESTIGRKKAALSAEEVVETEVRARKAAEAPKDPFVEMHEATLKAAREKAARDLAVVSAKVEDIQHFLHNHDVKTINEKNTLDGICQPIAERLVNGRNANLLKKAWNEDETMAVHNHLTTMMRDALSEDKELLSRVAKLTPKEIEALNQKLGDDLKMEMRKNPALKADITKLTKEQFTDKFKEALDTVKPLAAKKEKADPMKEAFGDGLVLLTPPNPIKEAFKEVDAKIEQWNELYEEASRRKLEDRGFTKALAASVAEGFTNGKNANFLSKALNSSQVEIRTNILQKRIGEMLENSGPKLLSELADKDFTSEDMKKLSEKMIDRLQKEQKANPNQSVLNNLDQKAFEKMFVDSFLENKREKAEAAEKAAEAGAAKNTEVAAKKTGAPLLQVPEQDRSESPGPTLKALAEPGTTLTPPSSRARFEDEEPAAPATRPSSPSLSRNNSFDDFVMVDMPAPAAAAKGAASKQAPNPELAAAVHDVQAKMHELAAKGPDKKTLEVAKAANHVAEAHRDAGISH